MKLVTSLQMRECDRRTIAGENLSHPTSGQVLMERAGWGIFSIIRSEFVYLGQRPILIFCGRGNNGGDGFVLARLLDEHHYRCLVILLADPDDLSEDARIQYDKFHRANGCVKVVRDISLLEKEANLELRLSSLHRPLLVDALLGTGSRGAPRGLIGSCVELINELHRARQAEVVAIDLPTGINADSGEVAGEAVKADLTISMAFAKVGFYSYPARSFLGRLEVVDIGIPQSIEADVGLPLSLMTPEIASNLLPRPAPDAHKSCLGRLLVIGGSPGLTGAPALTASAALHCGAGLITVATPKGCNPILEVKLTEAMTLPSPETKSGGLALKAEEQLGARLEESDVCVLGPGLGREKQTQALVRSLLGKCRQAKLKGLVIDADALFALSDEISVPLPASPEPILTPHGGEMARLLGLSCLPDDRQRWEIAALYARERSCILVLKGSPTIIANADGEIWLNPTGNAGLATGGSGDALAGIIAAFLGLGLNPLNAARLGVFLHGYTADILALSTPQSAITPLSLIENLGRSWQDLIS